MTSQRRRRRLAGRRPPVFKGISVRRGDGPETPNGVGGDGAVGRGAIHGQQEGLIAPKDEGSLGSGRAVVPGTTPLGEPGHEPPMVVGAKERVEGARKDVVARGRRETVGAGRVPWGEQGKANAGDREVVPPREESMANGGGVLTEGRVALRGGGSWHRHGGRRSGRAVRGGGRRGLGGLRGRSRRGDSVGDRATLP